jgi:hypothetical protein
MTFDSKAGIWQLAPFGSEDPVTPPATTEGQQQQNPPANQQQNNQGQQGNSDENDDDPYAGLSAKELKRLLKDAEDGKTATEAEKKKLQDTIDAEERKRLSKEEGLQKDLDAEKASNTQLRQALSHSQLENEILKDDRWTWHNIDDVIGKLPESVKVGDDGKVTGLTSALAKVAKDNEYLVKSTKDLQQQQNNGNQQQQNNNGPTGFQPGQGGANQGGGVGPNASELVKSYPALASRLSGVPQGPFNPQPNQLVQ